MRPKTPIMLITGSLGSGKTTLLRRVIDVTRRPMAVLMNELGELAIDGQVIQGEHIQIVELAGGCVCCSLAGEFEAAVREIVGRFQPEFILVEATGVTEADLLVYGVEESLSEVRLDAVVCIVDAYVSIKFPHVGYTTRTQLEAADVVLINKVDLVTTSDVKQVEAQIRSYNENALLFKTVGCDIDPHLLFGLEAGKRVHYAPQHGDARFESFTYITNAVFDEDNFKQMLKDLSARVFRAKGFVRFCGTSHLFNYVSGRAELEEFKANRTQLVFIGCDLEDVREGILAKLRDCEIQDAL